MFTFAACVLDHADPPAAAGAPPDGVIGRVLEEICSERHLQPEGRLAIRSAVEALRSAVLFPSTHQVSVRVPWGVMDRHLFLTAHDHHHHLETKLDGFAAEITDNPSARWRDFRCAFATRPAVILTGVNIVSAEALRSNASRSGRRISPLRVVRRVGRPTCSAAVPRSGHSGGDAAAVPRSGHSGGGSPPLLPIVPCAVPSGANYRDDFYVQFTDLKGLCLMTALDLLVPGTFLFQYTGVVRTKGGFETSAGENTNYGVAVRNETHLPKGCSDFVIDANLYGNLARYINDSRSETDANCRLVNCLDEADNFIKVVVETVRPVPAGSELTVWYNY